MNKIIYLYDKTTIPFIKNINTTSNVINLESLKHHKIIMIEATAYNKIKFNLNQINSIKCIFFNVNITHQYDKFIKNNNIRYAISTYNIDRHKLPNIQKIYILNKNDSNFIKKLECIISDIINIQNISNYMIINKYIYNNDQIRQICCEDYLKEGFYKNIMNNNNFIDYNDPNKPCIFYGMFTPKQFDLLKNNNSLKIIVWTGGDILEIKKHMHLFSNKMIKHIAISKFIANDLVNVRLNFYRIPFMGINLNKFNPIVKGKCIYIYTNLKGTTYGSKIYNKLIKIFKDISFLIVMHPISYKKGISKKMNMSRYITCNTQEELIKIYSQCFLGLRLTQHDGLSATVQELGCMGRKCVHNGDSPSCLNYRNINDIINIIKNERKNIGKIDYLTSAKVKKYLNIGKSWLYPHYYLNKNNLIKYI